MRMKKQDTAKLIAAAQKKIRCDLVVTNVRLLNVLTGEIYPAFVEVLDGTIVYVGTAGETPNASRNCYDGRGQYLFPGFIDIHMHVESSMLLPENFGIQAVVTGTTSVFVDPHEIGNVLGVEGIRFMVDRAEKSPIRQFNLAPSCIPADCEFVDSEFSITEKEMRELLDWEGVYGIAEGMDYKSVIEDTPRMHGILREGLIRDVFIQGHVPKATKRMLAAYHLGGPDNTHTARSREEVSDSLRFGLHVNLQSSSLVASALEEALAGMEGHLWTDSVSLCTDDVHAKDLYCRGHINAVLKQLVSFGINPVLAIKWATINAAREAGIQDLGAVAPGYAADFQIVEDLDGKMPTAVFVDGVLLAEKGTYVGVPVQMPSIRPAFMNTIRIFPELRVSMLEYRSEDDRLRVNVVESCGKKRAAFTFHQETFPVKAKKILLSPEEDLCYVCVVNRFGRKRFSKALYRGLGLTDGAMAASVSHDSHNIVVAYKRGEDAMAALRWMERFGGGFCCVQNGKIIGELKLPVAGLMSLCKCEELVHQIDSFQESLRTVFSDENPELLQLSLLCLTVLPGIAITDEGLIDCTTRRWIEKNG